MSMGLHEDMLKESISELELREAILVSPETPLRDAVEKMREKRLGGVIVTRSDDTPIGAIEEREVLKAIIDSPDALDRPVADHLSLDFACLKQSDPIAKLPEIMQTKRVRFVCEEFRDPLSNYDPPSFDEPIEESLVETTVDTMRIQPVVSLSPDDTVQLAVETMIEKDVGCVLIVDENRLVGVFTKRDAIDRVVFEYEEHQDRPVRDVMTTDPTFVYDTDPVAAALCAMASGGYRHIPILDVNDHVVGIVGPLRVTAFLKRYFKP
jgi:CBS domain-containing protein